jgi:hypothetical protein
MLCVRNLKLQALQVNSRIASATEQYWLPGTPHVALHCSITRHSNHLALVAIDQLVPIGD